MEVGEGDVVSPEGEECESDDGKESLFDKAIPAQKSRAARAHSFALSELVPCVRHGARLARWPSRAGVHEVPEVSADHAFPGSVNRLRVMALVARGRQTRMM